MEIHSSSHASSLMSSSGATAAPSLMPKSSTPKPDPTFVQTHTSSFKQVVQMLTGSAKTTTKQVAAAPPDKTTLPPAGKAMAPKQSAFKFYKCHNSKRNLNLISLLVLASFSLLRMQPDILLPNMLNLPMLVLSSTHAAPLLLVNSPRLSGAATAYSP